MCFADLKGWHHKGISCKKKKLSPSLWLSSSRKTNARELKGRKFSWPRRPLQDFSHVSLPESSSITEQHLPPNSMELQDLHKSQGIKMSMSIQRHGTAFNLVLHLCVPWSYTDRASEARSNFQMPFKTVFSLWNHGLKCHRDQSWNICKADANGGWEAQLGLARGFLLLGQKWE